MPRIAVPTRDDAPAESQPILDSVGVQLGFIPNLHRLMSLSPAALTGLIGLRGALGGAPAITALRPTPTAPPASPTNRPRRSPLTARDVRATRSGGPQRGSPRA